MNNKVRRKKRRVLWLIPAAVLLLCLAGGLYLYRPQSLEKDLEILLLEDYRSKDSFSLNQAQQDALVQLLRRVQLRRSLRHVPSSHYQSDYALELLFYVRESGQTYTLRLGEKNVLFRGPSSDRWHQYSILEPAPETLLADILAIAGSTD